MDTVLLTGMPRSGTTLVCALLNEMPNTVALAEPLRLEHHGDRARAVDEIGEFIVNTRSLALASGRCVSKNIAGVVPDNLVSVDAGPDGLRGAVRTLGEIPIGKQLSADFRLVIKHPAEFTALADLLVQRYRLFALVRDPLAVLASWETVDMPVHRGRMPSAMAFDPALAERLAGLPNRRARQIALIDWLLGTYAKLPPAQVLRLEDVLACPQESLLALTPHACAPKSARHPYEIAARYPGVDIPPLARALVPLIPLIRRFYPDIEQRLGPWLRPAGKE